MSELEPGDGEDLKTHEDKSSRPLSDLLACLDLILSDLYDLHYKSEFGTQLIEQARNHWFKASGKHEWS